MEYSSFRLTDEEKYFVVFCHEQGKSYNQIIEEFQGAFKRSLTKGAISKLLAKYYSTSSIENFSSPGRPLTYSERDKRELARIALLNQDQSLRDIENDDILNPSGASKDTIQRSMVSHNIRTVVRPERLSQMTQEDMKLRMDFAKTHLLWTLDDWKLVLFADEADLFPTYAGKQYLRLKENQSLNDVNIEYGWMQKKITIKVWGVISFWGVGPLIRIEGTMKGDKYLKTLREHLEPLLPNLTNLARVETGRNTHLILVDDNAKYHRVKDVLDWRKKMLFPHIEWPSYSPELNLIENDWGVVEDKLYDYKKYLNNPEDVWQKTQHIWHEIEVTYLQNLYKSLPDRIENVLKNKGSPIHY